ncbi:MAG: hypothetical protein ABIQ86_09985 [Steroidobacteraceae bacterium]
MNTRHQLESYLAQVRRRLQWIMASQSAALLAGALLLVTLLAAVALGRFVFSDSAVLVARLMLLATLAGVVVWYVLRLRALRRNGGATQIERVLPAQGGRVTTYLQESAKEGKASVLLDLLAEDAQRVAEQEALTQSIPARRLWLPGLIAGACAAALVGAFLIDGLLGEGAKRLWLGKVPTATRIAAAAGGIAVQPGNTTVRRNQDLGISALVARGGSDVNVYVRFDSDGEWEAAPMQADGKGGYAFTLFAVREAARYYVASGSLKSKEHRIEVVDLPKIEHLRLTYDYPQWTGLKPRLEESGGDIRAVSGTRVSVEVVTDKPLDGPLLVIDDSQSGLTQSGATSRGNIAVKKAGHYRIATRFGNEIVPLTPDYAIDIVIDEKPTVQIVKPGKDYQATNIEEVPVNVRARDDFRLEALELHYSVNGGDWRSDKLPAGSADIQAAALLRLEELQQRGPAGEAPLLAPGDLVSYYALARDHASSTQTDLFLIQVAPFERRFTQSQANGGGGGGGGGGEEQGQISQRQKEVLLATWNLAKNREGAGAREKERDADNARMLSEVQQTLADQANTLVQRARQRELTGDKTVADFVKSLQEAAKEMLPAAKKLSEQDLQVAIQHEQKALQHLLRAEATMRDIQVAMQSQGGGGGGGGGQAGRDVAEMTELELDLEKNQYETEPQTASGGGQQQAKAEDEISRRLKELARRQEQLARDAARKTMTVEEQRYKQQQLQREAEQLKRELEQLAQQNSPQSGSQQARSQQQQGGQQQRGQQQGQQGGQQQGQQGGQQQGGQQQGGQQQASANQTAAEAARQVAQAVEQMQQAQARGDQQAAARAGEQLNRARDQIEQKRQQQGDAAQQIAKLAETARDLADRQEQSGQELRAAIGNRASARADAGSGLTVQQRLRLSTEKRDLAEELAKLQTEMDALRRQSQQQAPRASQQLARTAQELRETGSAGSLTRIASDILNDRGARAAVLDGNITQALRDASEQLGEAAQLAANETDRGKRQPGGREADVGDLVAEVGELRRLLDRASQDAAARNQQGRGQQAGQQGNGQQRGEQGGEQNQRGGGEPGAQSGNASEGQQGQPGGQSGQQGQGGQGQRGGQQGGNQQAGQPGQGGANGGGDGGAGNSGNFGGGADRIGGFGGRVSGEVRPLTDAERKMLRDEGQLSAQRLQQIREQLPRGSLGEADIAALQDLALRLSRKGVDPMLNDYKQMMTLVNQLELAALKAQQAKNDNRPTRSADSVDDSRRYRDNVAEYYRKLGEAND